MRKMPREQTFRNSAPVTTRNRNATRDLPVPVCLESPPLVLHFPEKIYLILETENPDIIRWETDTGIFRIVDHSRFEHETIPRWFKHSHGSSVQRQLNLYGFKCVSRGEIKGAFFHPLFKPGQWQDVCRIRRAKVVRKNSAKSRAMHKTVISGNDSNFDDDDDAHTSIADSLCGSSGPSSIASEHQSFDMPHNSCVDAPSEAELEMHPLVTEEKPVVVPQMASIKRVPSFDSLFPAINNFLASGHVPQLQPQPQQLDNFDRRSIAASTATMVEKFHVSKEVLGNFAAAAAAVHQTQPQQLVSGGGFSRMRRNSSWSQSALGMFQSPSIDDFLSLFRSEATDDVEVNYPHTNVGLDMASF